MIATVAFALIMWLLFNATLAVCFIFPIDSTWLAGGTCNPRQTTL